jgi:SAM-dependent methyltransferase
MREILYWQRQRKLVFLDQQATPEFWDARWVAVGTPPPVNPRDEVVTVTPRYLEHGARVLEGGCGRGNKVRALADTGFRAVGIDFAADTVARANATYPDLDIRKGDVRALDFDANSFDGYWSIGVIEHFWDGYDAILSEAARVLRPGGVLFLTAPWFSPLRQRKAVAGDYPAVDFDAEPKNFYQFALRRSEVSAALARHGFEILSWQGMAAELALQNDVGIFRRQLGWLFGSRGSILKRLVRRALIEGAKPYCGHSFMAVARNTGAAVAL